MYEVTVRDTETGETGTKTIEENDYFLLTTGSCYLAHTVAHANGTHVLTVREAKAKLPKVGS